MLGILLLLLRSTLDPIKVMRFFVQLVPINLLKLHHRLVVILIVIEIVALALAQLLPAVEEAVEVALVEGEVVVLEISIEEFQC